MSVTPTANDIMVAYHEIKIDIVNTEVLERSVDSFLDALVPRVVELGGNPDLVTGHA